MPRSRSINIYCLKSATFLSIFYGSLKILLKIKNTFNSLAWQLWGDVPGGRKTSAHMFLLERLLSGSSLVLKWF